MIKNENTMMDVDDYLQEITLLKEFKVWCAWRMVRNSLRNHSFPERLPVVTLTKKLSVIKCAIVGYPRGSLVP